MTEKNKVAVLTTFTNLPRGYGLVPVVLNQLRQLVEHDYEVGFFVVQGFEKHADVHKVPEGVDVKPFVPFLHLFDYKPGTKEQKKKVSDAGEPPEGRRQARTNLKKQVSLIEKLLEPRLIKYPVVITHDIVFQTWFIPHNQAIRNIGERHPEIKWIHWLHSGPSPAPNKLYYPHTLRHTYMPNSVYISPNMTMIPAFAQMYNAPKKYIKAVYHTFDPVKAYDMHPLSVEMMEKHKLIECDVLCVWATRIDHPVAKGMFHAIHLLGEMNKTVNAKLLFLNSWSKGERPRENIERMRKEGEKRALPQENIIFSSEMGEEWENGVPWEVVRDMLSIGNMFVLPSETETFSLSMLEAAAFKNMLILNAKLGVMTELAGDRADYIDTDVDWGGVRTTVEYKPTKEAYVREMANHFLGRLGHLSWTCEHCGGDLGNIGAYKPLIQHRHVLRVFNSDWTWVNQILPLLEGAW